MGSPRWKDDRALEGVSQLMAAKVVVKIKKGMSSPKGVWIDGHEISGVDGIDVSYGVGEPRRVYIKLFADEVIEEDPDAD